MRQPQLAQGRVPKDPRGRVSAAFSLNSAPCAPGREEGRKWGAWWLRPPYTAVFFFFPLSHPVDPVEVKTAYAKWWELLSYEKS